MKKILSIMLTINFLSLSLFSQTINDVPISKLDSEFITVSRSIAASIGMSIQGRVMIDFGNGMYITNMRRRDNDEAVLKDANGKIMELSFVTHALNLIADNGYDLIDTNITPYGEGSLMYTYLLAKKIQESK